MKARWVVAVAVVLACSGTAMAQEDYATALGRGAKLAKARNYPAALTAFQAAVSADPSQLDGYFNAGAIAEHLGKCREELRYYRGFLFLTPGTPDDKAARAGVAACEAKPVGTLVAKPDLAGMEASVDGALVGRTPVSVKLAPGTYRVVLRHPEYEDVAEPVTIQAGEDNEYKPALTKKILYGWLEVKTDPADGVEVFLDDKPAGTTPIKEKMRLETKKYFLRLEKPGYDSWIRNVTVGRDRTLTVTATLEHAAPPATDK